MPVGEAVLVREVPGSLCETLRKFRAATGQIIAPGAAINTPKSFELLGSVRGRIFSYVFSSYCVSAIFSAYLCDLVGRVTLFKWIHTNQGIDML